MIMLYVGPIYSLSSKLSEDVGAGDYEVSTTSRTSPSDATPKQSATEESPVTDPSPVSTVGEPVTGSGGLYVRS